MNVQFMVGCLCVTYKGNNYLIEHCEDGWCMRVGKMKEETFNRITEAIEKKVLEG